MNFLRRLLAALLICLPSTLLLAQLKADFTTDKTGGCSPLSISFTNTSTGVSGSTTYEWNFDNGNHSTLQHAGAVFTETKSYTITLTIKDGQQSSTQTKTITVYKKPSIDFSVAPTVGCWPFQPLFTSTATPGDGSISSWTWDFGDGGTQQTFSPTVYHTYQFPQKASVSLTAINNYGCSNTLTKPDLVTILPPIKAGFEADKTMFCNAPGTVQFSNNSSGPGTLVYDWDFGDGRSSSQANPSHTYTQRGTYTIKLTVRNAEGCVDVMTKNAYINVADFTTAFQVQDLICTDNYITFNNTSTPYPVQSTWLIDGTINYWSYGNYSVGHSFTTEGTHAVQLTVDFGSCQRTITKQVEVKKTPKLEGFISEIKGLCGAPVRVDFRDTTAGAVTWKWNFNWYFDYNIVHSTAQAPSYTYTTDNWYYAALTVTNAAGCTASTIKQIGISRPLVGIFLDGDSREEDCSKLKVKFNTRTTEQILTYAWNFGDGATSTLAEPEHIYNTVGFYTATLTYKTINGCTGTVSYGPLKVRQPPKANFSVQPNICGNTPVNFINQTTGYITGYIWNYGDNAGNGYDGQHQYQAEGIYDVTLIAYNGICNDTITKPAIIKVSPPFARIAAVANTCDGTRGLVKFTDGSRQANSWQWSFGDGTTTTYTSAQAEITHTYASTGTYKVVQTVTNGSCTVKDSTTVYVLLKQKPVLSSNTASICVEGGSVNINLAGLVRFALPPGYTSPNYFHQVIRQDGTPIYYYEPISSWNALPWNAVLSGLPAGDQTIRIVSQSNFFNCYDTSTVLPIRVKGPTAAFDIVTHNVCYKSPVVLRDKSVQGFTDAIVKWEWNFGDGEFLNTTQAGNVQHIYKNPGTFYISLRVTDAAGCSAFTTDYSNPVNVTGPKAAFSTSSGTTVQLNTTINFYNYTNTVNTTNTTYLWNFGNGVTSTDYSPTYTFTRPGDYVVSLIAENAATQCRDTAKQTITVRNFNTGFVTNVSFIGNYSQCPPVIARFNNTSVNYTRLVWDFGDGFTLEDQAYPSHVYERAGVYIVKLYVYGYNGLTGTYTDTINAGAPSATIAAGDIEGCIGHPVKLNAPTHAGVSSYLWDFGNGYLVNANDSFATHNYMTPGSYSASLLVKDAAGCQALVSLRDKILIHPNPVVSVNPVSPVVCKGAGVLLQASGASSYEWTPAQGLSDNSIASPLAIPAQTTLYSVTATDANGCTGTGSVTVTVPKPFQLSVSGTADVCKGSTVQLSAAGANSYQWINTTAGLSSTQIPNPTATPQADALYTIVGYDQYRCYSDTNDVRVTVRPLPTVNAGPDREVVYGSANVLNVVSSPDAIRWTWSPPDFLSCASCPAPVSKPYANMSYVVSAYNNYNCVARDTILIKAFCTDGNIYIPSAFTPNGDGKNDYFGINGTGVSIINSMRIFNRWGEIVFERKNFYPNDNTAVWNGRLKGVEAVAGTYVYFIEMQCDAGQRFERKGTVTLVR